MNAVLAIGLSNALLATVLAVVAWLITRRLRRPQVALVFWLVVLGKLVTPSVLPIPYLVAPLAIDQGSAGEDVTERVADENAEVALAATQPAEPIRSETPRPAATTDVAALPMVTPGQPASEPVAAPIADPVARSAQTPVVSLPAWRPWIALTAGAWLMGSLLWVLLAAARIVRFRRLLARAEAAPADLQREVDQLAARLRLHRAPQLRLTRVAMSPAVWTLFGRATVVVPRGLVDALTPAERSTLLAHELTHVRAGARCARWLELAALALFWWHPVAWWARREIEMAEEQCCDARVVGLLPHLAHDYAQALLTTVEYLIEPPRSLPLGARAFSQASLLHRRMDMILKQTTFRKLSWPVRLTLVLVAATVLPLSIRTAEAQKPETAARVKAATKGMTVEQRLERVENLVQELVDELRADRKDRAEQSGPVVLTTVPANGDDAVDPNTTEIKVTFNKKMKDGNWSWVTLVKENFPETTGKPRYEEGQKTCVLPVKLEPGKTYTIGINSGRFNSFKDMSGRSATPLVLEFKTKS